MAHVDIVSFFFYDKTFNLAFSCLPIGRDQRLNQVLRAEFPVFKDPLIYLIYVFVPSNASFYFTLGTAAIKKENH